MKPINDLLSKKIENIIKSDNPADVKADLLYDLYEDISNAANMIYGFYENQMEKAEKEV